MHKITHLQAWIDGSTGLKGIKKITDSQGKKGGQKVLEYRGVHDGDEILRRDEEMKGVEVRGIETQYEVERKMGKSY